MMISSLGRMVRSILLMAGAGTSFISAPPLAAQTAPTIVRATLSADTVGIGDVFELTVTVGLTADQVIYFPDSLAASAGVATVGAVEWSADQEENGGATLYVTYRLLAVQVGIVSVPAFNLYALPRRTDADPLRGVWTTLLDRDDLQASAIPGRVPESRLWVASVLMLDDITNGLQPRPADDVWGGDRHWPATLMIVVFVVLLVGVAGTTTKDWIARGSKPSVDPVPPPTPKELALEALDELFQAGLHSNGRIDEFYLRSSDIARRYIETLDDAWDEALTSGELMAALAYRPTRDDVGGLRGEMGSAETVKFGRTRPETESAEAHWQLLYDWIQRSGAGKE